MMLDDARRHPNNGGVGGGVLCEYGASADNGARAYVNIGNGDCAGAHEDMTAHKGAP